MNSLFITSLTAELMVFERFIWAKTLVEGLYAKKKNGKKGMG